MSGRDLNPEITPPAEGAVPSWQRYDRWIAVPVTPAVGELVWVYEEYDLGVTAGYFDGTGMRPWTGSEHYSITHWMRITPPAPPEENWP